MESGVPAHKAAVFAFCCWLGVLWRGGLLLVLRRILLLGISPLLLLRWWVALLGVPLLCKMPIRDMWTVQVVRARLYTKP